MPHINRIRVNNVKYNFGTQFYDDFVLRLSGRNTIYDLANGGGKSVLMLLLLQNLIPNCTLDEKQPVEKLFRSGSGSTTIHSLIEWKLNKNDVKNGFQYMTTGFCARKAKDSRSEEETGRDTAAIEYFNYCIFYREFGDNDIRNLPLSSGKERITFSGLKSYLRDLEKKDFGVIVKVFDRKGDYQRYISDYGLYESEWEIIRGINRTEGHVRTYFENTYRTTRKVVEDLLIEEIIQKSFYNKTSGDQSDGAMADVLLDIKDKLNELSRKKNEIAGYERQNEVLNSFIQRIQALKAIYEDKKGIEDRLLFTYHTCIKREEGKQAGLKELKEEQEKLYDDRQTAGRLLETAKIRIEEAELKQITEKKQRLKETLEKAEAAFEQEENSLSLLESANDYLDYQEYKKQHDSSLIALQNMESKNEKLLDELHALAFYRKHELDNLREEHAYVINSIQEESEVLERDIRRLREEERDTYRTQIMQESSLENLEEERGLKEAELIRLQKEGVLNFGDEAGSGSAARTGRLKDQLQGQLDEKEEEAAELQEASAACRAELARVRSQSELITDSLMEDRDFLNQYAKKKNRAESLKEVYRSPDYDRLITDLAEAGRQNAAEAASVQAAGKELRNRIKRAEDGSLTIQEEGIRKLSEYLERCHSLKVTAGSEYLKTLSEGEREALLENNPILPYGVIADGDIGPVAEDMKLREKYYGSGIIPIFDKKSIEDHLDVADPAHVVFKTEDRELLYRPEKASVKLRELHQELEEYEKRLARLREDGRMIGDDRTFLGTFTSYYMPEQNKRQEKYEEGKRKLKLLEEREQELADEQQDLNSRIGEVKEETDKLNERLRGIREYAVYADRAVQLTSWLNDAAKRQRRFEEGKEAAVLSLRRIQDSLKEKEQRRSELEKKTRNMELVLERLKDDWERNYRSYYKEGLYPPRNLKSQEIEAAFKGRKEVFEQKNADAADKQKLSESYLKGMEKCRESIEYRGISMEQLAEMESKRELYPTKKEELLEKKRALLSEKENIVRIRKELETSLEAVHKKQGSISHAKTMLEETYGPGEPEGLENEDLTLLLQDKQRELKELEAAIKENLRGQKELETQCYALNSMKEDMERIMRAFDIPDRGEAGLLEAGVSLKKEYEELRSRYEKLQKDEYRRRESFEKDKLKLVDTLEELSAFELAEEMKYRMKTPQNLEEMEEQIAGIQETIRCIDLEKERIGKGIEDMERIRDTFENQCLQTCMNIKTELDRLPKLSRIHMDGHQISMITLNIPYRKEEQFKDSMAAYIDDVVKGSDTFESPNERLRYIRSRLAWKKLFSVIVTDMDSIRLNLYKRERIKEQSRYLKYEEAVGSTGQSQGIYIQFLVAIINYITSINSRNADPKDLKKVIFIDNPFGAAKDVYIWEPIFKLLKANNVQLIVPARGATPALTGRFEVNYVLGQKLIDGRQQTVIVDYRSQTDSDDLEYRRLEYDQPTLMLE